MIETVNPVLEQRASRGLRSWAVAAVVSAFICLYLGATLLRAHEKLFWYDEIFTVVLCRLSPGPLWKALVRGADQNPPLFYLITQASEHAFGTNEVGVRIPEILGFLVFSLCLFRFVRRIAGFTGGFVAMALPMLTGAYYYAYEARPHALVMGFAGLCLVCWQNADDSAHKASIWLGLFGASLFGALMMHCYAVVLAAPFAITEILGTVRDRRLRVHRWAAIFIPGLAACGVYIPMFLAYRQIVTPGFLHQFPPTLREFATFYTFLLTRCSAILLAFIVCAAVGLFAGAPAPAGCSSGSVEREAVVLSLGFLALPLFGIALSKVIHGPFFARYFLSAIAGIAILLGVAVRRLLHLRWRIVFAAIVAFALVAPTVRLLRDRFLWHMGESIIEPSSAFPLVTKPPAPMISNALLDRAVPGSDPIAIAHGLEYVPIDYYRPDLRPRLYPITDNCQTDDLCRLYARLQKWGRFPGNSYENQRDFIAEHPRFWLYGDSAVPFWPAIFANDDQARITEFLWQDGHYLARIERAPAGRSE
jgi:hypothetical protein